MLRWGLLLACVACGQSAEVEAQGVSDGKQLRTVMCGGQVDLDRYSAGTGGLAIDVVDGGNRWRYHSDAPLGQVDDSSELSGTAGTWQLTVEAADFIGQYDITLSCR